MAFSSATARMYLNVGAPNANFDNTQGYEIGNFLLNTLTDDIFQAKNVNTGAAVWSRYVIDNGDATFSSLIVSEGYVGSVTTPGAYPYTALNSDNLILASSSAANTVNLMVSPATGFHLKIKDATGNAGANTITIQGNGNNIDGASSITLTSNYQSVYLIFNGTEWNVI